jgi:hypothetical protein
MGVGINNQQFRVVTRFAFGLGIFYACFLSVFSLDVFEQGLGLWKTSLELLIHLIPSLLIILLLLLGRLREWLSGIGFSVLGLAYIYWAWGQFPLSVYFLIAGPLFILASLFFFLAYNQKKSL